MNIFVSHQCPIKSAQNLPNVLLIKMTCESAQILSTVHHTLDGVQVGYKPTHSQHPSTVWTRSTSANYQWLYAHFKALCEEYTFRTGKIHKSSELLSVLDKLPMNIKKAELEPFALCMPDHHKRLGLFDQTVAYRSYLKEKYAEWTCREKPIKVSWGLRNQPEWI